MRIAIFMCGLLAAALPVVAANAGFPVTEEVTCPIGGEKFEYETTASYSTYGQRPDGKPYGSWTFPLAMPVCPGNGLVLFKKFTDEELAALKPLIESDEYRALIGRDTPYYRAHWLMKRTGAPAEEYLWALLQASWEADSQPELRARYLAEFAEASATIARSPEKVEWLALEGRGINALRELARFEESAARLARLLEDAPDRVSKGEATGEEVKNRQAWHSYFRSLATVIARRDASSEPLDMVPQRMLVDICLRLGADASEHDRERCQKDDIKEDVDRMRRQHAS